MSNYIKSLKAKINHFENKMDDAQQDINHLVFIRAHRVNDWNDERESDLEFSYQQFQQYKECWENLKEELELAKKGK